MAQTEFERGFIAGVNACAMKTIQTISGLEIPIPKQETEAKK